MSGLPRPTPAPYVLELTRRLAEDYHSIPLPEVSRVVQDAAAAATGPGIFAGTTEGLLTLIDAIERVARDDLDAMTGPLAVPSPAQSPDVRATSK